MDAKRWQRIQGLLESALALPDEERSAHLERECNDPKVRAEVESLLDASAGAESYFEGLAERAQVSELAAAPEPEEPVDLTGRRIGAYRLERFLGRGGMGTVYLGQRVDGQFEQRVAIKLLALGAMEPEAHRRFLAEREILARLQHAHIARLFDGGVTEDGTPWFVMEYVEGERIDRFSERNELSLVERLQPFLEVCEAVAYAHRNLVVHRDLKPANILVTTDGVRLLDFGIAKLLTETLDDEGARQRTLSGRSALTPAYASPEQVLGQPVTTATDVYTLGVLLHELLSGLMPYECESDSPMAVLRAIVESPRIAPSVRVRKRLAAGAEERAALERLAHARRTSALALGRELRGDLDTIVLKALQADPGRRYESVDALAEDLRRHLDGRPILARPPTLAYRTTRFLARHRLVAALGGVVGLLLLTLLSVSLWFWVSNAHQARRVAEERGTVQGLLAHLTELYTSADPEAEPGTSRAARRVLDDSVARLRGLALGDPETRSALLFAAGRVYRRLGLGEEGEPLLQEALTLRRELHSSPHETLAEVLFELGASLARSGEAASRARVLLEECLGMERALHGDDHVHVARACFAVASLLHDLGESGSEAYFNEAVRVFRLHPNERKDEYAEALLALGDLQAVRRDLSGAIVRYEEGLEIYESLHGHAHPTTARALNGLGLLLYNERRVDEGIALLSDAVEIHAELFGDEPHPDLAMILQNLGGVLATEGDPRGIDILRQAVAAYEGHSPVRAADLGFCLTQLGNALRDHERRDDARAAYLRALDTFEVHAVDELFRANTRLALAALLRRSGRSEQAIELMAAALASYRARFPAGHPRVVELEQRLDEARRD